ncbi:hypothetical protein ACP70R_023941 [Stipagrostis hirtigluma subsp. patula]
MPTRSCRRHGEVHEGGVHGGSGTQGVCSQVGIPSRARAQNGEVHGGPTESHPSPSRRHLPPPRRAQSPVWRRRRCLFQEPPSPTRPPARLCIPQLLAQKVGHRRRNRIRLEFSTRPRVGAGGGTRPGEKGRYQWGNRWLQLIRSSRQTRLQRKPRRPPETSEMEDVAWRAGPVAARAGEGKPCRQPAMVAWWLPVKEAAVFSLP